MFLQVLKNNSRTNPLIEREQTFKILKGEQNLCNFVPGEYKLPTSTIFYWSHRKNKLPKESEREYLGKIWLNS